MTATRSKRGDGVGGPAQQGGDAGGPTRTFVDRLIGEYRKAAGPNPPARTPCSGGTCTEVERAVALAHGDLDPEGAAAVRRHLETCFECMGEFQAASWAAAAPERAAALSPEVGPAMTGGKDAPSCGDPKRIVVRSDALELDYPSLDAFRDDVARLAPDIALQAAALPPVLPGGTPDWVGILLVADRPEARASDEEGGWQGSGKVVLVRRGKLKAVALFDVIVTHRRSEGSRTVVSWYLPDHLVPMDPEAQYWCAWVSREGRLWTPVAPVVEEPDEGRFVAQFPADADPRGELRFLLVEFGG